MVHTSVMPETPQIFSFQQETNLCIQIRLTKNSTLSIMKLIFAMGLNTPKYGQMRSL